MITSQPCRGLLAMLSCCILNNTTAHAFCRISSNTVLAKLTLEGQQQRPSRVLNLTRTPLGCS